MSLSVQIATDLARGSAYSFANWPNPEVPTFGAGVYTIWNNDSRFIYAKTLADMKPPGYWSAKLGYFVPVRLVPDLKLEAREREAKPPAPAPIDPADINYEDMDTETLTAALGGLLSENPERGSTILRNEHTRLIAKAAAEKVKMLAILEAMPLAKSKLEVN